MIKKLCTFFLLTIVFFSGTVLINQFFPAEFNLIGSTHAQGTGIIPGSGDGELSNGPQSVDARAPFFPGREKYDDLGDYVGDFYTFAIWLVTIVSVIMIIWGGYLIITSSGNPESVKKGQEIVYSSLVSLGILLLATVILRIISPQIVKNPWVEITPPDYGSEGVQPAPTGVPDGDQGGPTGGIIPVSPPPTHSGGGPIG